MNQKNSSKGFLNVSIKIWPLNNLKRSNLYIQEKVFFSVVGLLILPFQLPDIEQFS